MLARYKLNIIESKISEALINNENGNEDFMTIINKEINYRELNKSKMMKSQRSDIEKINPIEEDKKQVLMKLLNSEIINDSLKSQI